jgi:hypothetical protein
MNTSQQLSARAFEELAHTSWSKDEMFQRWRKGAKLADVHRNNNKLHHGFVWACGKSFWTARCLPRKGSTNGSSKVSEYSWHHMLEPLKHLTKLTNKSRHEFPNEAPKSFCFIFQVARKKFPSETNLHIKLVCIFHIFASDFFLLHAKS